MFRDAVSIKLKPGNGGNGVVRFYMSRMPCGGNGGNGGNIYFQGEEGLYDLSKFKAMIEYKASNGTHGSNNTKYGENGADITLKVPLVTKVFNEHNDLIATISKHGEKVLVAKGGAGGLGNATFKADGIQARYNVTDGKEGNLITAKLVLEMRSDVIFIGFPNAGKSSILKELTNADAKVAAYAFTTINPQLGEMDKIVLMDLPGLIEGSHEGKGLGTRFVKHTKSAKLLAHFISLEEEDIKKVYKAMREELKAIDENLFNKREIIVLTKSDLVDKKKIEKSIKALQKFNQNIVVTSAYDYDSLENLKKEFKKSLNSEEKQD